jgi:uncharacterized membrane protein
MLLVHRMPASRRRFLFRQRKAGTTMEMTRTNPAQLEAQAHEVSDAERWISVLGGGLLGVYGLTRRNRQGALLALLGGSIAYRGMTGRTRLLEGVQFDRFAADSALAATVSGTAIHVDRTMTMRRPLQGLYAIWRRLEDLPRLVRLLESVLPLGGNRVRWTVSAPIGTVHGDAEILENPSEEPPWRALEGSEVPNDGAARFRPATVERGTDVRVKLTYQPPRGPLGTMLARLFGDHAREPVGDDLLQFKQALETAHAADDEARMRRPPRG